MTRPDNSSSSTPIWCDILWPFMGKAQIVSAPHIGVLLLELSGLVIIGKSFP